MRISRGSSLLVLVAVLAGSTSAALADVTTDRPAAILIFPRVLASRIDAENDPPDADVHIVRDTTIQISNTSDAPVTLQCFYINANSHCSISGQACAGPGTGLPTIFSMEGNPCPLEQDLCLPGWIETDFRVILTGRQPLAWRASTGLAGPDFPLNGTATVGPTGQSNAGSAIPPVTLEEVVLAPNPDVDANIEVFKGELKCIVVDDEGQGIARNVIKGEATVTISTSSDDGETTVNDAQVDRSNAIGIQAIEGDLNGDGVLELGGEANEYNGCPNVLIANHIFDFSPEIGGTVLTLVPCREDLRAQEPGVTTAQFLVFNEFEQRFSTSALVDCYFDRFLSSIDTLDASRSIWSQGVAGTIVGQTRIRGVSGGLLGILAERVFEGAFVGEDASVNLHVAGERALPDQIIIP